MTVFASTLAENYMSLSIGESYLLFILSVKLIAMIINYCLKFFEKFFLDFLNYCNFCEVIIVK